MSWLRAGMRAVCLLALAACGGQNAPVEAVPDNPALSLQAILGGEADARFLRAEGQRVFLFPEDHGLHPGFRNEWWYFTGNLLADDGRRFGFQLTWFTHALAPEEATAGEAPGSAWQSNRIWMAHFALTDVAGERHLAFERFSRENPGLAGARIEPGFRVWLDDWQVASTGEQASPPLTHPSADNPWLLTVAEGQTSLQLSLHTAKLPVLHGEEGLSRKSARPGNASWYYSLTRMPTAGELRIGDQLYQVEGETWLDREWSTSALDADQQGWDWFSLQFDDGSELMYYRLRDAGGQSHPFSAGSLVDANGRRTALAATDAVLEELDTWTSRTGVSYGTRWRMQVAGHDLLVSAVLRDQWMDLSLPYWEGAVDVHDASSGAVLGRGYLEMVR